MYRKNKNDGNRVFLVWLTIHTFVIWHYVRVSTQLQYINSYMYIDFFKMVIGLFCIIIYLLDKDQEHLIYYWILTNSPISSLLYILCFITYLSHCCLLFYFVLWCMYSYYVFSFIKCCCNYFCIERGYPWWCNLWTVSSAILTNHKCLN